MNEKNRIAISFWETLPGYQSLNPREKFLAKYYYCAQWRIAKGQRDLAFKMISGNTEIEAFEAVHGQMLEKIEHYVRGESNRGKPVRDWRDVAPPLKKVIGGTIS